MVALDSILLYSIIAAGFGTSVLAFSADDAAWDHYARHLARRSPVEPTFLPEELEKLQQEARGGVHPERGAHPAFDPRHPAYYQEGRQYGSYLATSKARGVGFHQMHTEEEYKKALAEGKLHPKDMPYIPSALKPEELAEKHRMVEDSTGKQLPNPRAQSPEPRFQRHFGLGSEGHGTEAKEEKTEGGSSAEGGRKRRRSIAAPAWDSYYPY